MYIKKNDYNLPLRALSDRADDCLPRTPLKYGHGSRIAGHRC